MRLLKPDPLPEYATFNQITLWLCPDDDRVTKPELRKCLYKIKQTLIDACTAGTLAYEGVIGGWTHGRHEKNPYPNARPGKVNSRPNKRFYDAQGREYAPGLDKKDRKYDCFVDYTNDHITIDANEFKIWYLDKGGKARIDALFFAPLKPLPWWKNYKLSNNERRNRIATDWLATEEPDLKDMTDPQIIKALVKFSGEDNLFGNGGLAWLYRDHSVIPQKKYRQ
ncbi:MAG: hypothetical protein WCP01_01740 [Methylococcaceae bacterium]